MKGKNIIFILLLITVFISLVSPKEFNYEEFKKKAFQKKIKYLIISFFNTIEQYTFYFIFGLNVRKISEPYDFFFCFIAGMIFRIILFILRKIYISIFNLKDNYIYNEIDNAEDLYKVIKKLDELKTNLNQIVNENGEEIINNNEDKSKTLNLKEVEKINKKVNDKLKKLEEYTQIIEKNYNDEKENNEKILKTIQECQQFIKNSLENNQKEEEEK